MPNDRMWLDTNVRVVTSQPVYESHDHPSNTCPIHKLSTEVVQVVCGAVSRCFETPGHAEKQSGRLLGASLYIDLISFKRTHCHSDTSKLHRPETQQKIWKWNKHIRKMAGALPNFGSADVTNSIAAPMASWSIFLEYTTSNSHILYIQNQFLWLACITFAPG